MSSMFYSKLAIQITVKKASKTDGRKVSLMESRLASVADSRKPRKKE
jgi:hypothetical protein